ncbi:hypothetical protein EBU99_08075 [bacterium]|nr:hypothetical protein [bacterium]
MNSLKTEIKNSESYVLFNVQGELYGTPMLTVREIVPFQTPRAVPNTKKNFLGVINLRGDIVGVVDLRIWFQDDKQNMRRSNHKALLVVESDAGVVAVAVDAIEAICSLEGKDIESSKGMPSSFAEGGMIGLGKFKQGLATLVDLRALCSVVEIAMERKERWAG